MEFSYFYLVLSFCSFVLSNEKYPMGSTKKYLIQPFESFQAKLNSRGITRLDQGEGATTGITAHQNFTQNAIPRTLERKMPEINEKENIRQGNAQQTPKFTNLTEREKKSMTYHVPQNGQELVHSLYTSHDTRERQPQRKNYHYSKNSKFENRQDQGLEESSYLSYDSDPTGFNETELLALRIEQYLLEKENYFYHKGKFISNLVIALYAISLSVIFIAVGITTYIANQTNGRRRRDIDEAVLGGRPNLSLQCIAKLMCELQQQEDLFGERNRENVRFEERPRISSPKKRKREAEDTFAMPKTRRKSQRGRVRSRRQLSYRRDCSNLYQRCSVNFSIFFRLWKMFFT